MYLLRLDDASEHWDKSKWHKMHDILERYGIKPIFAIIPHNEDSKLLKYAEDPDYKETILTWIEEGWTPALHGYNHVLASCNGGINPVNNRSEFAGLSLEEQSEKIKNGYKILHSLGIETNVFVAPAHTFDRNTLLALYNHTSIRVISDTVADDVYYDGDFWYVPQQSGQVRGMRSRITTFCYHPNTTSDEQFDKLENFLKLYAKKFISYDEVELKKRKRSIYDKFLSAVYFGRRRIISVMQK